MMNINMIVFLRFVTLGLISKFVEASPLSHNLDSSLVSDPSLLPRVINSEDCRLWAATDAWTTCSAFITQYKITLPDFVKMNPSVRSDCYNFQPGARYCLRMPTNYPVSKDRYCGRQASSNQTCIGSLFGNCCGSTGLCGSTDEFCGIGNCQAGECPGLGYSTDGLCGPNHGNLMCGGVFGTCCSKSGNCGSTNAECGVGNCASGSCSATTTTTTTSTSATPLPSPFSPSPDGTCGYINQYKCTGTPFYFGSCCGAAGYCGTSFYECSDQMGCQAAYGLCDKTVIVTVTKSVSTVTSTTIAPTSSCTVGVAQFRLTGAAARVEHGEIVHIAGSAPALGSWGFADSIPMSLTRGIWGASVSFTPGEYAEYKYFWVADNGTVVWTSEPNYVVIASTVCPNTGSAVDMWR